MEMGKRNMIVWTHPSWSSNLFICLIISFIFGSRVLARPESLSQFDPGQLRDDSGREPPSSPSSSHLSTGTKLPSRLASVIRYFDKIDVDAQLSNKRFVNMQIDCLVYDKACDFFGRQAKALLPSIILDNCRLCSTEQKNKLSRVVVHMQQTHPRAWRDALDKYGSAPKFITAGQVAPQVTLFGNSYAGSRYQHPHHHPNPHSFQTGTGSHGGFHPQPLIAGSGSSSTTTSSPPRPTPSAPEEPGTRIPASATLMLPPGYEEDGPQEDDDELEDEVMDLPAGTIYFQASPAPDPIPAVESPTPAMDPTTSPYGLAFTSSAQPPSTPVMESTIEVKPTTVRP